MKQQDSHPKKTNPTSRCREIDFTNFKASTRTGLELDAHLEPTQSFTINRKSNYISTIMVLSSCILQKYPVSEGSFFTNFKIHNVPQEFQPFTHPQTLNNLLKIFHNKTQSLLEMIDLMCSYPIMEFLVHCFGRKIIHQYITSSQSEIDLMGNQFDLLQNYEIQMRGNLLQGLARSLNQEIILTFPSFIEKYGNPESPVRIEITLEQQKCRWVLSEKKNNNKKQIKLLPSYSSKNIANTISPKMGNSLTLTDTTSEQLSVKKSVTGSLKRQDMSTQYKYEAKFDNLKYISPRQLTKHNRNQTDGIQFNEQRPKKLAIRQQNYKFCLECKQMYCFCKA